MRWRSGARDTWAEELLCATTNDPPTTRRSTPISCPTHPCAIATSRPAAWLEAPGELRSLGSDLLDAPVADYKRRIGPWLLWRAGPATGGDARYWACDEGDLSRQFVFRLYPDGTGEGVGPSGARHERFRAWKEDLRDAEVASREE